MVTKIIDLNYDEKIPDDGQVNFNAKYYYLKNFIK